MGEEVGFEKKYVSIAASLSGMTGPSGTVYDFRSDQSIIAKNALDEQWMDDLCVDRTLEKPPYRARLKRFYEPGECNPATIPVVKESVFGHAQVAAPPDMSHEPVHYTKTPEELAEEAEADQQTENLRQQQAIIDEFLSPELLDKSISDVMAVLEAFLTSEFDPDIPQKMRMGAVNAFVINDPQQRKTLPSKVEDLLVSIMEAEDADKADADITGPAKTPVSTEDAAGSGEEPLGDVTDKTDTDPDKEPVED